MKGRGGLRKGVEKNKSKRQRRECTVSISCVGMVVSPLLIHQNVFFALFVGVLSWLHLVGVGTHVLLPDLMVRSSGVGLDVMSFQM